jgi:hypothetical protein
MLRRVTPVRTNVPEQRIASIIKVTIIGKLGIRLAVTSNGSMLPRNLKSYTNTECWSVRKLQLDLFDW